MFDRIIEVGPFTEKMARYYFLQIMQALNYCHSNKICHRDLKPENFLLLSKAEDSPLKVTLLLIFLGHRFRTFEDL